MCDLRESVMETLCWIDIEGSGSPIRTVENLIAVQNGLHGALGKAFGEAGIPWRECEVQGNGDDILTFAPESIDKELFAGAFLHKLADELVQHNETHAAGERIRLRLALNTALITRGPKGRP